MSGINEQEPSKMIRELSKALSSKVDKTERISEHCSKIDTTEQLRRKSGVSTNLPREINVEDDLKNTIEN